jgi:uncharacterized membrane protein YfcA
MCLAIASNAGQQCGPAMQASCSDRYNPSMDFLIYPLCGVFAGLLAGLFGVGGGLVIVPVLSSVFVLQGLAPDYVMQMALGTSLVEASSRACTRH